jgi:ComF family protein
MADEGRPDCPDCRGQAWALQACHAAVDYGYPWTELIRRYKFEHQSGYSDLLARLMLGAPQVAERLAALEPDDWLLPLPLSAQRLAERGFNQAWALAQALHRRSGCRAGLQARLLIRIRHTQTQTRLDREQRQANVRGAFLVEPLLAHAVRGRTVVLVDDVMTSGASLNAAAQVLLQAQAARVEALVVARTPP